MKDYLFRTEDIKPEDILKYFVESKADRVVIDALKNRNPTIIVGSRGVGKSFLLRVAQKELLEGLVDSDSKVFPIYLSFVKSSLLQTEDPEQFKHWMLAKLCSATIRALSKAGLLGTIPKSAKILAGTSDVTDLPPTPIETITEQYENSWKKTAEVIDSTAIPSVDDLKEALEDLAEELGIERFVYLIDEAAHIFMPANQRQFFTLFRDLRSHCITCNAAVYPGVTNYGETFQPTHDATTLSIDRDVLSSGYVENMREIVEKQAESSVLKNIAQNGKNFAVLAYAASGNPRILLKTLAAAPKLNSTEVNEAIKDFYLSKIWAEHSALAEKYEGHKALIDWGRNFVESIVLPELKKKNDQYLSDDKNTSTYIWLHRDAPAIIKEALRILSYTGVLMEQESGLKATRAATGTRYFVNLGCLFTQETNPALTGIDIARGLTVKRMTEFGANHSAFKPVLEKKIDIDGVKSFNLANQLKKSISVLDLTSWQKSKLDEMSIKTIEDLLTSTEQKLKTANYVGDVRARQMKNAAFASVFEYLSG
ncbi:MAG: hypothetical protein DI628_01850 [Blastochloris viridis]|uniref:Uncharacterized protein n=1 Tax=Blastochloris viridis TaxID=1079 RepID=A0A6N4REE6_BLAVI|nr:MAG: hypothetical protein DI628_01850 [Blastochloris viridis]